MESDKNWGLAAVGLTGTLGVIALLAAVGAMVFGVGYFSCSSEPRAEVPARVSEPVEAQPVPPDDMVGMALASVLERAGLQARLLVFFERGGERIYGVDVHGAEAIEAWELLRAYTDESGFYPVILGEGAAVRMHRQIIDGFDAPTVILEGALIVDVDAWREARVEQYGAPPRGTYEFTSPQVVNVAATTDILTGSPFEHVAIALVPTRSPWEVPAYLGYGGWNECPPPEVHVALMKRWYQRHGAEIVSATQDTVEMQVARPPIDQPAALELATEHYVYCSDIVYQGTGDLDTLAAGLESAPIWFFWWD